MRRVFRDAFGNRGRIWHVDDKRPGENYLVVGLCGVRLASHAEIDSWPDDKRNKMCARCRRRLERARREAQA